MSEGLRGVTQKADLQPLLAKSLVTQEVAFPSPPPRPKTDRQVRLLADAEAIARALPTLGRASKQADALAWLANQRSDESTNERISKSANQQLGDAAHDDRQFPASSLQLGQSVILSDLTAAVGCTEGTSEGAGRARVGQLDAGSFPERTCHGEPAPLS